MIVKDSRSQEKIKPIQSIYKSFSKAIMKVIRNMDPKLVLLLQKL